MSAKITESEFGLDDLLESATEAGRERGLDAWTQILHWAVLGRDTEASGKPRVVDEPGVDPALAAMAELRENLDLVSVFEAQGRSYVTADADGTVVHHPAQETSDETSPPAAARLRGRR